MSPLLQMNLKSIRRPSGPEQVYEVLLQLICDHHSTAKLLPNHVSVQDNMPVAAGLININPHITLNVVYVPQETEWFVNRTVTTRYVHNKIPKALFLTVTVK